jgi:hypothetical protein
MPAMSAPRKLAAILAADVAGYSRLTGHILLRTPRFRHSRRRTKPAVLALAASHTRILAPGSIDFLSGSLQHLPTPRLIFESDANFSAFSNAFVWQFVALLS